MLIALSPSSTGNRCVRVTKSVTPLSLPGYAQSLGAKLQYYRFGVTQEVGGIINLIAAARSQTTD